jgi:hypothetical protein
MKLADKVSAIEDRTVQASMLQVAQSFREDAGHYTRWLCSLADLDVLKEPGRELRDIAARSQREVDGAPGDEPEDEEAEALIWACVVYEIFGTTQRAWREPGAENTLFDVLREDTPLAGLTNAQMRITLDREIERLAKVDGTKP